MLQAKLLDAEINVKKARIAQEQTEIEMLEEQKHRLDLQISDDCERQFTEKQILELIDEEMKTQLKADMNEEDFNDYLYKVSGIVSCALHRR